MLNGGAGPREILDGTDVRGTIFPDGMDLAGVPLRDTDMAEVSLRNATLAGASLVDATLVDADLRGANYWEAELNDSHLGEATLEAADLRERRHPPGGESRRGESRGGVLCSCGPVRRDTDPDSQLRGGVQ